MFPFISLCKHVTLGWGLFWPQGHNLNKLGRGPLGDAKMYVPNIKAQGLMVSDKKNFMFYPK